MNHDSSGHIDDHVVKKVKESLNPHMHDVSIPDGSITTLRLFSPSSESHTVNAAAPLIMLWPGFGMGARYYDPIARELASRGFRVAVGELRGQGSSTAKATRKNSWGYHHLASEDYPCCIRGAKEYFNLTIDHPTVLLTHSMGGQIGSLFLARPDARELGVIGMMGVGSGSPYYQGFTGRARKRLRYGTLLVCAQAKIIGYQPGGKFDFSGYGRQSRDHLVEWYHFAQTNNFGPFAGEDMNYEDAMKEVDIPVLFTRFSTDDDCPVTSSENLAKKLKRAFPRIEDLPQKLGHNRWAREPEVTVNRLEQFLKEISV